MTQVDFRLFQSKSCRDFDQSILIQYVGGQVCVNSSLVVMWAVRWAGLRRSGGCYFSHLRRNDLIRVVDVTLQDKSTGFIVMKSEV